MSVKTKQTTPRQKQYQDFAKRRTPNVPVVSNSIRAFLVGGAICLFGQGLQQVFIRYFGFSETAAANPTVAVLVFLSCLLTGLGLYDRFGQWAGAGTAVPVTGFANGIAAAAIEYRSEGFVQGVGGNMFKIAGPVIVYGTVSAFFVALVRALITLYW
jgi:stage V sporulation protein AC